MVTLPGAGPFPQAEELPRGCCTRPLAPWSPKQDKRGLSAALMFSSCPPQKDWDLVGLNP